MKRNLGLGLLTITLVGVTTLCKYFFGPELSWSGFSPVIAVALLAGFLAKNRKNAFLLPILSLVLSDLIIQGLYSQGMFPYAGIYEGQWVNYLLLLGVTCIGFLFRGKNTSSVLAGAFAAPTLYFLVSNFIVWQSGTMYAKTIDGLFTCYTAALPFYRNSLVATFIFLPVLLFAYNYFMVKRKSISIA